MSPIPAPAPLQLFVEHVTHVDCGVLDSERGLTGATWLVDVTLAGDRDAQGMVLDFGPAKRWLKAEIDTLVDHRLLVPTHAEGLVFDGRRLRLTTAGGEVIDYEGPTSAFCALEAAAITPEGVAAWLSDRLARQLPANVETLTIELRAEAIDGAHYNYCHGLSAHDGNCQRLAHGHRSRLTVAVDGVDRPDYARAWAKRWQGVFIGTRAQCRAEPGAGERLGFAYDAPQGRFALAVAKRRCVLLDAPATVENIADHIAAALAADEPEKHFVVRAYEGVGKGATARRGAEARRPDA